MATTYAQVSVRLSAEEMDALDRACARAGVTRNAAIRRVLVRWAQEVLAGDGIQEPENRPSSALDRTAPHV